MASLVGGVVLAACSFGDVVSAVVLFPVFILLFFVGVWTFWFLFYRVALFLRNLLSKAAVATADSLLILTQSFLKGNLGQQAVVEQIEGSTSPESQWRGFCCRG